ncbi:MAG: S1 RNA-binding domain-containing protein [Lachnospiraceae bacterium]|nr:S1 RNA-binding domain-containing protein [Lachnospiraceae bacterium]
MFRLGDKQVLRISDRKEFGVYLTDGSEDKVLLPVKQVPEGAAIGDELEVFLYRDSQDRMIATTKQPLISLGKVALLTVKDVGKVGAFLDWGLEKDLLLPFKEQTYKVNTNDKVLVALYTDKSDRLCATMKVYPYLEKNKNFKKDDQVKGIVYEISSNFGAFVAIDNRYSALIPKKDLPQNIKAGDEVFARVTGVKADGKVDLSVREKAYIQMSIDADRLVKYMQEHDGVIPFTDKASPQLIGETMNMSKNEFKRAVGNLLKSGMITIETDSITLKKMENYGV